MEKDNDTWKDGKPTLPSWLEGTSDKDLVYPRNKTSVQAIQHTRGKHNDGDTIGPRGRSVGSSGFLEKEYKSGDRRSSERKIGSMENKIDFHFTMQQLRDSLDDTQLNQLLKRSYVAHDMVTISKASLPSKLPEDFLRTDKIKKTRTKRIPTVTIPSMFFYKEVEEYKTSGEAIPEAAVGVYFRLYKKLFHEEDAMWAGVDPSKSLDIMKSFGNLIIDNDFILVIIFLKKLLPLWKEQLLREAKFPNNRPTFYTLFDGNRHFWTNRKIYYKQWAIQ